MIVPVVLPRGGKNSKGSTVNTLLSRFKLLIVNHISNRQNALTRRILKPESRKS